MVSINNNITGFKTKVDKLHTSKTEYHRDVVNKTENELSAKTIEIEPSVLNSSTSKSGSNNSQSWFESILTAVIWKDDNTQSVTTLDLRTNNFTNNEMKHLANKKSRRDYQQWYQSFINHFRLKCSSREPRKNEINEKLEGNVIAKDTKSFINFTGESIRESVRKESCRDYQHWYYSFINYFRMKCPSKELAANKVGNEKIEGNVISKRTQTVGNLTHDSVKESLGKESYQLWYRRFLNYFKLRCSFNGPEKNESNKKTSGSEVNLTKMTSNTGGNVGTDSLHESWYEKFIKNFNVTGVTFLFKKEAKSSNVTMRPHTRNITDYIIPESIATKNQILIDDYKPLYNPTYDHIMSYIFTIPHTLSSFIAKNETTLSSKRRVYLNQSLQEQNGNVSKQVFGRRKLGGKGKFKFSCKN